MTYEMKQQNISHTQEKLIEIVPKEALMLELIDKDIKSTIINMFEELKETMSKE